ncbi:hypothetical protein [Deinococcus geothermalis]|uniref:hypothetical protein n=1 Tax=Deinococcus geothermalis TaxID=68909 RepID=UPI0023535304|nr:hypothetical protein [Deinococcus geothermalis]
MQSIPVDPSDSNLTLPQASACIWSMAELRERARAQGLTITEAIYSRLSGWTARAVPRRAAVSRTWEARDVDALTGTATHCTVTVSAKGPGLHYEVDGAPVSAELALTLLNTCTHLRLVGETLAAEPPAVCPICHQPGCDSSLANCIERWR